MKISPHTQSTLWFLIPFCIVFALISILRLQPRTTSKILPPVPDTAALLGQQLPTPSLINVDPKPSLKRGFVMPDTAYVLLLGGIGCSGNQVDMLEYWSSQQLNTPYPIIAIYADPNLGIPQSLHETRLLRHVSRADFPFLVSQDTLFNPRALGIPTPQLVLTELGIITHVFDHTLEPHSSGTTATDI